MEASPSPVYGARLLSGFGATTPSRVQIPPPPPAQPNPPPGSPGGELARPVAFASLCKANLCSPIRWCGSRPVPHTGQTATGTVVWIPPEKQSGEHHGQARHQVRSGDGCRGPHLGSCQHGGTGGSGRHQLGTHRDPPDSRDSLSGTPIRPETRTNSTPPHVWSQRQSPRPVSERGQRIRCPRCHLSG